MKPRNLSIAGNYFTWTKSGGLNPTPTPSSARLDQLNCPLTINQGNHRDPTGHFYTLKQIQGWRGSASLFAYDDIPISVPPYAYKAWVCKQIDSGIFSYDTVKPSWDRDQLYNMALERLNDQVRGGLDLAVELAQSGQTYKMIKSLRRFTTKLRGGALKVASNGWLEYQYGWRPLIQDIYDVADESQRFVLNRIQRVSASATLPFESGPSTATCRGITLPVSRSNEGKQGCKLVAAFRVPKYDIARWTSLNPATLAWELIPYSFVVDWFVDIGSYIRNLETALLYGAQFVSGYRRDLYALQSSITMSGKKDLSASSFWMIDAQMRMRWVEFQRTPLSSYPMPLRPQFRAELGWQRFTSAAALVTQVAKRNSKPPR